jgi:hypothetical protein
MLMTEYKIRRAFKGREGEVGGGGKGGWRRERWGEEGRGRG